MPGEATLIVTTRSGVRPLGVRGEPLHNAAPQLRRVVRRRLGDEAADLLADPQLHENDQGIDWYAGWSGPVRAVADLPAAERDAVLAAIERTLAEIRRLGDLLAGAPFLFSHVEAQGPFSGDLSAYSVVVLTAAAAAQALRAAQPTRWAPSVSAKARAHRGAPRPQARRPAARRAWPALRRSRSRAAAP